MLDSGCWIKKPPEAALKGIRKVIADIVADLQTAGETIPEAIASKHYSGKFMVRIPPDVHRKLAIQAAESGVSPAAGLKSGQFDRIKNLTA
jgi:predicted HicB family RNase H-like nuclease